MRAEVDPRVDAHRNLLTGGDSRGALDPFGTLPPRHGDDRIDKVIELLLQQEAGRQQLFDRMWAAIPLYEHEESHAAWGEVGATPTSPIGVAVKTVNPIICKAVAWSVPYGVTSATLTLGDWTIPLQNTFGILSQMELWLDPTATRQLAWSGNSTAGPAFLGITGQSVPTYSRA